MLKVLIFVHFLLNVFFLIGQARFNNPFKKVKDLLKKKKEILTRPFQRPDHRPHPRSIGPSGRPMWGKSREESDSFGSNGFGSKKGLGSKKGFGSNDFGSNGFGSNDFGSNGFGSNGFGSNGFGSNGFGSNGFGSNGFGSNGFGSNGFGSNGLGSNGFGSNGLGSNGFGSKKGFGSKGFGSNSFELNSFESKQNYSKRRPGFKNTKRPKVFPGENYMVILQKRLLFVSFSWIHFQYNLRYAHMFLIF